MIFTALLSVVTSVVVWILNLLPSLPDMPQEIVTAAEWMVSQLESVYGVLAAIYSPGLLSAIATSLIALLLFEQIYHLTMWVIRKLPIGTN
jgi:hypothetical protein